MFRFLSRSFPHLKFYISASQTQNLAFFQLNQFSSTFVETLKSIPDDEKKGSFTVNYLIKKCGLTPEKAVSASKSFTFDTPEKPDSVISFFKNQKFTETQISNILKSCPLLLVCDPEVALLPKIRLFESLGFSLPGMTGILSKAPGIFRRNLEEQLIPFVDYIKVLVKSDKKATDSIKRFPSMLLCDHRTSMVPNISLLRETGVAETHIVSLLTYQPRTLFSNPNKFKRTVEKVKELKFSPLSVNFVVAVRMFRAMTVLTWEKKVEIFKKWGWSDSEILEAFGRQPWFISASEDKIMGVMNFLVNEMGFERSLLLRRPGLVAYSLQKRIKPRCIVYKALLAKGLVKKKFGVVAMLEISEESFLRKYVKRYKTEAPELLDIYKKNLPLLK